MPKYITQNLIMINLCLHYERKRMQGGGQSQWCSESICYKMCLL
ncbi:hypothetical protein Hdeb2414_s1084g00980901 [Helianthus debilis subsp. tardiflorus]